MKDRLEFKVGQLTFLQVGIPSRDAPYINIYDAEGNQMMAMLEPRHLRKLQTMLNRCLKHRKPNKTGQAK